jgi:regulator of protease activity HflC (stomatin/prohibitin superfamily)
MTNRQFTVAMRPRLAARFAKRQLTAGRNHIIMISYLREAEVTTDKVIALTATSERPASTSSGYAMLIVLLLAILADAYGIQQLGSYGGGLFGLIIVVAATVTFTLVMPGFFMLQPNQAAAITLFGEYRGSDRATGLRWTWPWLAKKKLSVRANNFISDKIKVNDLRGNPIEMAAQIVWRVVDTAQALFDVDDYKQFVRVQVEAAVRTIGSRYPYDDFEHQEVTLRGNHDQVGVELRTELQARLAVAGITVDECGFTHLAYAQEIAGAMLRRQQAQAVVAARKTLVEGAVGMVEMALAMLSEKNVVELDDERRAAMVSNLMVVLCGERDTQPVVNTGTLYQ